MDGTPLGVVFSSLAEADPDRPLITVDGGRTVTRREFDLRTNRLAHAYQRLGVTQDSFVTIGLPNGVEIYEATVAAWKLGATPAPISSKLPGFELNAIIDLTQPSLVVGLDLPGFKAVPAGFEPEANDTDEALPPAVAKSYKAPTSGGSTGRPKLIVANQPSLLEPLAGFFALARLPENGVNLVTGPLYHNGPFITSLLALLRGNHLVVMERFDAARSLELIEKYSVDWMYAVPTMMHRIWRLDEAQRNSHDLSSLQVMFHMAAPCPQWLKQAWIEWIGPEKVLELYAGTETQAITFITGTEWLTHKGSVGRAVIGEIQITDNAGTELRAGEIGEIWMRRGADAPVAYHYVGAEARAREDNWEFLGDMGFVDEEGYLYISDRDTDMILVGGSNVYPAEVEAALDEFPKVKSSCVIGLPDDEYGNAVHAIVQAEPIDKRELDEFLSQRLTRYKIPRTYEFVSEPLRGDDGKVRRPALRQERLKV